MNKQARRRRLRFLAAHPFKIGDRIVYHRRPGTIIGEWGMHRTCQACAALLSHGSTCCGRLAVEVPCHGIFDVRFDDGETKAINPLVV
jgi:hypothetical protein